MKRIKLILSIAAAIALTATASAETEQNAAGWNHFYASYDMAKINSTEANQSDLDFNGGFTIGYNRAQSITPEIPLYIEYGLSISHQSYKEISEDPAYLCEYYFTSGSTGNVLAYVDVYADVEDKLKYTYLSIPVSATYCVKASDKLSILPFAGLNLKCGFSAKTSSEIVLTAESKKEINTISSEDKFWKVYEESGYYERYNEMNLYDEEDMGKDYEWSRLLFGYQVGVNFSLSKLTLGIKYQGDLSQIFDDYKYNCTSITLGARF